MCNEGKQQIIKGLDDPSEDIPIRAFLKNVWKRKIL